MSQIGDAVQKVLAKHHYNREALVEILKEINQELDPLPKEALGQVAEALRIPYRTVMGVASFYSMINLQPRGQHVIKLCQDLPCHVAGGREIWETLEKELGIGFGSTTPDGKWTLLTTSCIGACSVGPVMLVDEEIYGNLTPERVRAILASYADEQFTGGK